MNSNRLSTKSDLDKLHTIAQNRYELIAFTAEIKRKAKAARSVDIAGEKL